MEFLNAWVLWLLLPLGVYLFLRNNRNIFGQTLRWVALAFLIIAVARPSIEELKSKTNVPIHALVLALDLSASMNAKDILPSRAKASRLTINAFLEENKHDQISLIGFTTHPLLLSPSTTDHHLVTLALESMRSEYILTKGTDLKKLLKKVADFPDEEKRLILFSDGGDERIDEALLTFAKEEHIEVLAIVMATQRGSTIVDNDNNALKDKAGHLVISKFNDSLASLAQLLPFEGVDKTAHQIQVWVEKQKLLKEGVAKESHDYFELYFIPTLLALLLLFVSSTKFLLKLVAILALLGVQVHATERQGFLEGYHLNHAYSLYKSAEYNATLETLSTIEIKSLESELILADTYYKLSEYKKAKSILKTLKSKQIKVKQKILYELGNCEAKLAYYEKAKKYYVKALQLGEDEDILHNLKVVLFLKKRDASKVGFVNPTGAEASNVSSDNVETNKNPSTQKNDKSGSSGGDGSKKSKSSTVKVVQSYDATSSKREMSSKAYDLINEGYIREEKPW